MSMHTLPMNLPFQPYATFVSNVIHKPLTLNIYTSNHQQINSTHYHKPSHTFIFIFNFITIFIFNPMSIQIPIQKLQEIPNYISNNNLHLIILHCWNSIKKIPSLIHSKIFKTNRKVNKSKLHFISISHDIHYIHITYQFYIQLHLE